jgi:hypothetical protein
MKRILLLLVLLWSLSAGAQLFNNEWIDYNKTYYKFRVGATGTYHIKQSTLVAFGLGSVNADYFQLWRNGQQVPIFTTATNAPLGSSDYIEFYGEKNDGKPDNPLYRESDWQLSDKLSLQTDTAAFFLTVNPAGGNLRITSAPNNLVGNSLPPEPYFMHTVGAYYTEKIHSGRAELVGDSYTYSASYDWGEGFSSADIPNNGSRIFNPVQLAPYLGAGAPNPLLKVNAAGNAINARYFKVVVNSVDSVTKVDVNYYDYVRAQIPLTVSQISGGSVYIDLVNKTATPTVDRLVFNQCELVYARTFNFGNANTFPFELPASPSGNYLEISNFSYSGSPVLVDLTNGKRYPVDATNPSLLKVVLQPSAVNRKLVMMSTGSFMDPYNMEVRNFNNYLLAGNQGDFLIITNSVFTGATSGGDPVEEYRQYRSSPSGGNFNAKIYLIDQLVDQFAYGIKMHPLSIRNFLRWARRNYSNPLQDVLIIGKGVVYPTIRQNESNPDMNTLCLVPTFGYPASDILLSAEGNSSIPLTPIGRLSVINKGEISVYLSKLKQYEQVQQSAPTALIADMAWKKNIVHVTGASDDITTSILQAANEGFRKIIEDTLYGGKVYSFTKTSSEAVSQLSSTLLSGLFNQGIGMLEYFGHSSASTLEFNLDNPQNYDNAGKYPIFVVMGCNAGGFYGFSTARFFTKETISERYVLAPNRGSIAFLASTHLGIVHYLDIYATRFYQSLAYRKYGGTIGAMMEDAIRRTFASTTENDFYARFQCEEFTLHGDPAIRPYAYQKPDFAIEDHLVKVSPTFISIAEKSFQVKVGFMNLGMVPSDKRMVVELKRTYPDNTFDVIRDTIPATRYSDSITYNIPIFGVKDKGLNKLTIKIDADNEIDETFESNNTITKDVYIFEDELRPVYPYNYSILNEQNPTLIASTANAFAESRAYLMEMDTTELFNSPIKIAKTTTSPGGIVEFSPGNTFIDSTVYYWRVAPYSPTGDTKWNTSSFIYINGSQSGFSQSHLYQYFKSDLTRITLDSASRMWKYGQNVNNIFSHNGVYPNTSPQGAFYSGTINDQEGFIGPGCTYNEIIFTVVDPLTFKALSNNYSMGPLGLYNSYLATCGGGRQYNFEYRLNDITWRKRAMDFIDSIPAGSYVLVRSNTDPNTAGNTYPAVWKADEATWGAGNSLYHKFLNQGFAALDSFYFPRSWLFMFKKDGQAEFTPKWSFSENTFDAITLSADISSPDTLGYIKSPSFGPAKAWYRMKWKGSTIDNQAGDIPTVDILGVDNTGAETVLMTNLTLADQDVDISSIDPVQYPNLKLRMANEDRVNLTPYQLHYWMLTYDPAPEGAIAPNLYFTSKDTVEVGEPFNFGIAFKNISKVAFDSVKVKVTVTDESNFENKIYEGRNKPLLVNDTLKFNMLIDTKGLSGHNSIFVNFNPDYDQAEQHLFNNYAFRQLYVRPDSLHPLMDVTFDGMHILNKDIVAAKPQIVIKLKDEAKWMLLDDPSLVTIEVKFPGGTSRKFTYASGNDTLQFIPASQSSNNTASINFNPYFLKDGDYELVVTGQDRSGNNAGVVGYRVNFRVINKPMISNMLNYPNPFTTSTAFVFTLTGSQVPQNLRIQILTITGKVVREITKDELGPIHVGRNITEFKWDGTDQYGQKLANGIYLYRVITNLNGKSLDKYTSKEITNPDNTDKFFNNGYGKMYLMR